MKKILLCLLPALLTVNFTIAQENSSTVDSLKKNVESLTKDVGLLKKIKLTGYIQAQYQYADSAGQQSFAGGNFAPGVDNRFMVRRGRIKVQYTPTPNAKGIITSQYTLQFDVTERGMVIKDAYAKLTDPCIGWFSVTAGQFNNPFGFEVAYSSSHRESPERGRMSQLLFPGEREVGAMLTIQGSKKSGWSWLKLDAGIFNGNGAPGFGGDVSDWDKKKDFSGRLSVERTAMNEKISYGAGVSLYSGGFRIDSVTVYKHASDDNGVAGFAIDTKASDNGVKAIGSRDFTSRQYMGADARLGVKWKAGETILKGEVITGDQPATASSAKSPNDKNPVSKDIYMRKFNGAYFYFIHSIVKTPFQVVVKYDWFDPNTEVKGDELGQAVAGSFKSTNETDVRFDTWGFGLNYQFDANIRVTAYYDVVKNEISKNLSGYTRDRKDNVFTLRMQVKF